jgi:hypothetical protein
MAQLATDLCASEMQGRSAPVVPLRKQSESMPSKAQRGFQRAYRATQANASRSYSRVREELHRVAATAEKRVWTTRDEHPLRLVQIAAAAAFCLGIALRVWRSHHE